LDSVLSQDAQQVRQHPGFTQQRDRLLARRDLLQHDRADIPPIRALAPLRRFVATVVVIVAVVSAATARTVRLVGTTSITVVLTLRLRTPTTILTIAVNTALAKTVGSAAWNRIAALAVVLLAFKPSAANG
jgi:hypothetical protein